MSTSVVASSIELHHGLRQELAFAREQTDSLFALIGPETLYSRPIAERHRLIFYLGHFEAFDWNVLARRAMSEPSFHPEFDTLFERGIDPAPGQAPLDSPRDWPTRSEVEKYNANTRAWVDSHFEDLDPAVLRMVVEHRHMHAETFAYLLHGLPYSEKRSLLPACVVTSGPAPSNPMIPVAGGCATLGQPNDLFGWDNERAAHDVFVPGFRISKFKISNGEYLDFVQEGGPVPHFWTLENNAWFWRGMFEQFPLPLDGPAWVTWQQASAYAKWRGLALPTEAQFLLAAQLTSPEAARDNFNYRNWDPIPINAANHTPGAPVQMVGNGWEWTRDPFAPFNGFEPHPLYPGYSADFFDGQHYVMKGASPRTAAALTRPSFRNWFRSDYPYMYAGFRLIQN
ncbi:MAG TPA: SUMF1/EgtB/PvdO family nonheme iron enzyme [Bryobacteraceae bacterium]|jgi:formylglycine-generating enzyme required for sulfatase activity|nr:SUMF1/EgtB/PvdO family nonheme iron enzyme [Bryobacteraceae bacterium]